MKPFSVGTKVQVLLGAGDSSPKWTDAVVVGVVRPNMESIGQSGNILRIDEDETKRIVTVTESGMIRND